MSVLCFQPATVYACTNATGTTCTKTGAVQVLVVAGSTTAGVQGCTGTNVIQYSGGESQWLYNAANLSNTQPAQIAALAASATALQNSDTQMTGSINTLATAVGSGGSGGSVGGTVTVAPYVATADDYSALSSVFGAVLVAACVIWGVRAVLKQFQSIPEA